MNNFIGQKRMGMSLAVIRLVELFNEKGYKVLDVNDNIEEWFQDYYKEFKTLADGSRQTEGLAYKNG